MEIKYNFWVKYNTNTFDFSRAKKKKKHGQIHYK